jgi:hypothetical protein
LCISLLLMTMLALSSYFSMTIITSIFSPQKAGA